MQYFGVRASVTREFLLNAGDCVRKHIQGKFVEIAKVDLHSQQRAQNDKCIENGENKWQARKFTRALDPSHTEERRRKKRRKSVMEKC